MGYKGQEEKPPRVIVRNDGYSIWFNRAAYIEYDITPSTKLGVGWANNTNSFDYISFKWKPRKNTELSSESWYIHVGKMLNANGFSWTAEEFNDFTILFNIISRQKQ